MATWPLRYDNSWREVSLTSFNYVQPLPKEVVLQKGENVQGQGFLRLFHNIVPFEPLRGLNFDKS